MGYIPFEDLKTLKELGKTYICAYNIDILNYLGEKKIKTKIFLKIDSGMHRLGF